VIITILSNEDNLSTRNPVRVEILSSAENTSLLDKDLHEMLRDASNCCEFTSYVDTDGETLVKIECEVSEDEKERLWDLLRFKHKRDCSLSAEPSELHERLMNNE
jgi:hypothetical protein